MKNIVHEETLHSYRNRALRFNFVCATIVKPVELAYREE
jgi:hypothetical protein